MSEKDKDQVLKIIFWVRKECSIDGRASLRKDGINPDELGELGERIRKLKAKKSTTHCLTRQGLA